MIEEKLSELLDSKLFPKGRLAEAARYSVLSGGKRLRPRLVLATAALFDCPPEKAIVPACAIEFIHTYSLIHDDLPCMDDDDIRRGIPTLHKVYPEGHALLTGDFLLTYAFELLATAPGLSAEQCLQLIATLAHRSGAHGVIGGQEIDIEGSALDLPAITDVHRRKTAALFTAAFEFGGIIAHQSDLSLLRTIGEQFGLLFQLCDDIADGDGLALILGRDKAEGLRQHYCETLTSLLSRWPTSDLAAIIKELSKVYTNAP